MIRVKGYFSASIRGKASEGQPFTEQVPQDIINRNIEAAQRMGARLRRYFGELLDLYVPHEQDQLIQILNRAGHIAAKQILDGDCKIIDDVDILFVWKKGGFISGGMQYEIDYAEGRNMMIIIFTNFTERVAMDMLDKIYMIAKQKRQVKSNME